MEDELLQVINGLAAEINSLRGELELKVDKDEIIDQINNSEEGLRINSDKILIDGETSIKNASISSAKIVSIEANKITGDIKSEIKSLT